MDGALTYQNEQFITLSVAFIAAFVAGLIACTWMIQLVRKSKLELFCRLLPGGGTACHIFRLVLMNNLEKPYGAVFLVNKPYQWTFL